MIAPAVAALLCFVVLLQIRIIVLQRRLLEEFKLRKPKTETVDGLTVKIGCDTSDFDIALKNTYERAQILCAAFESALSVGVKP